VEEPVRYSQDVGEEDEGYACFVACVEDLLLPAPVNNTVRISAGVRVRSVIVGVGVGVST